MTRGVGRLPVISHDDREAMIDIITRTDIAKAIESHRSMKEFAKE
jgi:predicted transcriptional regulator